MDKGFIRKWNWQIRLLGLLKIPVLGFVNPKLVELTDSSVVMKVKYNRRNKNHLNSIYFGALAVGADTAAGIHAFYFAKEKGYKISLAFKNMEAEFIKRVECDAYFYSNNGHDVLNMIEQSKKDGLRYTIPVPVEVKSKEGELLANFTMMLSVKVLS